MQLQEASFEMTAQAMDRATSKDDEKLRVTFNNYPHLNQEESSKQGRPIYDEKTYVTIIVPGQQDIVHRLAWRMDFERFPKQYAAYKNNQNQDIASGTPLKLVPWLTLGQVKELEYFNCFSVEQLANMADSVASRFMGIQKIKQLAKDYLQAAKEAAPLTAMRAELDKRENDLTVATNTIAEMGKRLEALEKEAAKKK